MEEELPLTVEPEDFVEPSWSKATAEKQDKFKSIQERLLAVTTQSIPKKAAGQSENSPQHIDVDGTLAVIEETTLTEINPGR